MKTKTKIKLVRVNGLKQVPKELDFSITPVLKFCIANKEAVGDLGKAWGFALEWGYWAIGIGVFTAFVE